MRFRVEITPLGGDNAGTDNFAVADHWQSALREVRVLRGEAGDESALSVEAMGSEAHRVIDAERQLRYVVEPAPESRASQSSHLIFGARDVAPSELVPLTYRERAVRLLGPASRASARHALASLLDEILTDLGSLPFGRVIELGAFASDAVDLTSPLATLSYRDWRGDVTWWFSDALPEALTGASSRDAEERPNAERSEGARRGEPSIDGRNGVAARRPSQRPPGGPARPLLEPQTMFRGIDELLPSSRRAQEELISDLFDVMHELDFARDVPSGVKFVLDVLSDLLPGRVSAVHVFDIDKRRFVLVGGRGLPTSAKGSTLPDSDPFFHSLLQRKRARRVAGEELGQDALRGHFSEAPPERLMASPMLHSGRDLGVIEVGDPEGPEPYSEHEAAALDYIALRLAEFLAQRPLVLDEEIFER